jgi:hypothetical protein
MDILYDRIIEGNKHLIKAAGLSTEVPPTTRGGVLLASGSQYVQVDTGILQMFDGRDGEWHNFAQFDTGSSASTSASLGGGLGGSLGGGFGGNPGNEDPETPTEGDA